MKDRERGLGVGDGLAILGPTLVVVVLPALYLARHNLKILGLHLSMFGLLAALSGALLLSGVGLAQLRHRHRSIDFLYVLYLLIAPFWLAYASLARWLNRDFVFLGMSALAILGAAALVRHPRARAAFALGLAVFGFGLVVSTLIEANSLRHTAKHLDARLRRQIERQNAKRPERPIGKAGPDVYHLVFDEFQTDLFEFVLRPEDRRALGGFVFFPNATTPYGRTDMALGATFSGEPYTYKGEPYDYIWQAFNGEHSLLTRLKRRGYLTTGLLHQVYPTESDSPFDLTHQHIHYGDFGGSRDQSRLFTSLWMVATLPDAIVDRLVPEDLLEELSAQTLLPASYGYYSVLSLRRYLSDEETWVSKAPRYVFVHMIVPHQPLALDENCREGEPAELTIEGQTACAIRLITEFVNTLKREGRFEDALVVMRGDHGWQYARNGDSLVRLHSEATLRWQRARSRPLLLVKPAGASDLAPFREDARPADLYDIAPTILDAVGLEKQGHEIGYPLTRPDPPTRPRDYNFYRKDMDQHRLIDGKIAHYRITSEGPVFDRSIAIER